MREIYSGPISVPVTVFLIETGQIGQIYGVLNTMNSNSTIAFDCQTAFKYFRARNCRGR